MSAHAATTHDDNRLSWHQLLHLTAWGSIVVLTAMGIVLRDRLPLGLAVVAGVGMQLMHFRGGRLGVLALGVLFADTAAWTLSAALSNATQGEELVRLVIPASLAAISSAGVIAALAILVGRRDPNAGGQAVWLVAGAALAFFVVIMLAGFVMGGGVTLAARAPDLSVRTENLAFSSAELSAKPGQLTVVVDNRDVWWHTFTIDELGVDVRVPSSGKRTATFNAPAGTYTYYCAIPGHGALGMRGTLTVR